MKTDGTAYAVRSAAIAVGATILGLLILGVFGLPGATPPMPPLPGHTKAMSPRAASSPDLLNKAMVLSPNIVLSTTNRGAVQATFEKTQIAGLRAGFVYAASETGTWKVLGSTNYPTNGGTLTMNYLATNVPHVFFRAFYQFPNPTP